LQLDRDRHLIPRERPARRELAKFLFFLFLVICPIIGTSIGKKVM
jgi:hypothetical protein